MGLEHVELAYKLAARQTKPGEFKVLMAICFQANKSGLLKTTQSRLGKTIGYSRQAVGRAVSKLEAGEYLTAHLDIGGRNNSDTTTYKLTLSDANAARDAETTRTVARVLQTSDQSPPQPPQSAVVSISQNPRATAGTEAAPKNRPVPKPRRKSAATTTQLKLDLLLPSSSPRPGEKTKPASQA